jgi:hypothetical protein
MNIILLMLVLTAFNILDTMSKIHTVTIFCNCPHTENIYNISVTTLDSRTQDLCEISLVLKGNNQH